MSSGDFASELDQSVRTHVEAIREQAAQAKARIGQAVAAHAPAPPVAAFDDDMPPVRKGAAVAFDDVPSFDGGGSFEPPDDPIFLDPPLQSAGNTDDDGVPVWEDIP